MSFPHLIVIALIALIVLGPEKLPQVARTLGKAMAEFRRITGDFRSTVEHEMREMERVTAVKEIRDGLSGHAHDVQQMNEETIRTAAIPPPPAEFTGDAPPTPAASTESPSSTSADSTPSAPHASSADSVPKKTEAASASGKLSNGEPNPA